MARGRKTLEAWIHEALTDSDKEGPATAISLVHLIGTSDREVHSKRLGPGENVQSLAGMLRGKAETYSQDMMGVQQFSVLVFYGKAEPEARFLLPINGETSYSGLATEPPTKEGQTMQGMRHVEMVIQLAYQQSSALHNAMARMLELMSNREARLVEENHEAYTIVKDVLLQKAQDDSDRRMKELEYARSTDERKKWLGFMPALVNQLLGREIFPQSTADTALVESIADSITEEQIAKLAGAVPPQLMGPLASRMQEYMTKKEAEAKARKELPQGNVEHELGGD